MTPLRPRTTGRLLRGSALGLGLLVAGGITAPAAFAVEDTSDDGTTEVPSDGSPAPRPVEPTPGDQDVVLAPAMSGDFGTGKRFDVTVTPQGPGRAPADLDLSGAVFRATPTPAVAGGPTPQECTTDATGHCSFHGPGYGDLYSLTGAGADAGLAPGRYTLTQVSASPGLAANTGSGTFGICAIFCNGSSGTTVADDSLFRTSLVATVTDVDTGAPVACAAYELTGPDYPHVAPGTAATPSPAVVPDECADPAPMTTSSPTSDPTTDPTTSAPVTTDAGSSGSGSSSPGTAAGSTDGDPTDPTDADATDVTDADPGLGQPDPGSAGIPFAPDVVRFAREDTTVSYGTRISDGTGALVFTGWFLPAEGYLLTPTSTPAGYAPDVTDAFGITTTATQAATGEPAAVARTLTTQLAGGEPAPGTSGGVAAAAPTTSAPTTTAAAGTTAAEGTTAAAGGAALATTGSPVGTMVLVGSGLVALGGGALATGTRTRRRARQRV